MTPSQTRGMLRLFIAVDTPPPVTSLLEGVMAELRGSGADVRWEAESKWHCTLKFLGDTPRNRVAAIAEALRRVAHSTPPFALVYRSLGCFPGKHDPRIVWAGIDDGGGALGGLYGKVDAAMWELGYEKEKRSFHPHVTLGRVRGSRRIAELLTTMETVTFESQPVVITQMMLVRSDLRPGGSVYTVEESYGLLHPSP
jgi:RNA 2',3'-cyclic 3'-phosphodiesterase